jgi:beta-lactamase regulating signal transducer with metallopeptidase domain
MLLETLLIAAARVGAFAAGTGLVLLVCRVKKTSVRLFTCVALIYVGLSMPFLAWLAHPIAIPIPFVWSAEHSQFVNSSADSASYRAQSAQAAKVETRNAKSASVGERANSSTVSGAESKPVSKLRWILFAVGLYFSVVLLLLLRLAVGLRLSDRLVRSSVPIRDLRLHHRLSYPAHASRHLVRESSLVSVPVTTGIIAPNILLPSTWREWDDTALDAVLTHELSHVKRHDSLSQFSSLVHRAIFWFSPFSWWLHHQIVELAEQASDEEALSAGAERNEYARTLLRFFGEIQAVPHRVYWHGVAMASPGKGERRLQKILAWKATRAMSVKKSIVISLVALAIPAVYVAAAAHPVAANQAQISTTHTDQASPVARSSTAPAPPAAPALPPAPANGGVSNSGPAPVEPGAPAAPVKPGSPAAPVSPVSSEQEEQNGFSYGYGFDEGQRFVIVSGKSEAFTMSGSSEDAQHVERLRKRIPGDFIWFQRDEKSYIIRDQATIDRARQLWAPQEELGKKQEELGKQQEALGKQQQELGSRMQQLRVKAPDITAELDKLKAELQQLGPNATVEQVGKLQAEIGELQAKVGEAQANAGEEQAKLGEQMGALGARQGKLGEQQGELGRQQAELAQRANRGMRELLDEAIKKGLAQPEPPEPGSASL